jgi:hypothetical protein
MAAGADVRTNTQTLAPMNMLRDSVVHENVLGTIHI